MADERDLIEFDTEDVLSEVYPDRVDAPNASRGCSLCGAASTAWPASELTVVHRRHGAQPLGHLAPTATSTSPLPTIGAAALVGRAGLVRPAPIAIGPSLSQR